VFDGGAEPSTVDHASRKRSLPLGAPPYPTPKKPSDGCGSRLLGKKGASMSHDNVSIPQCIKCGKSSLGVFCADWGYAFGVTILATSQGDAPCLPHNSLIRDLLGLIIQVGEVKLLSFYNFALLSASVTRLCLIWNCAQAQIALEPILRCARA
jgi:hypothetical protein